MYALLKGFSVLLITITIIFSRTGIASELDGMSATGVIVSYVCRSCLEIKRKGVPIKPNIHLNLFENDTLKIARAPGSIVYRFFGNGRNVSIGYGDASVRVPRANGDKSSPLWAALAEVVKNTINTRLFVRPDSRVIPFLDASSSDMSPSFLPDNESIQQITAGSQDLRIAWQGGIAPYDIVVKQTNSPDRKFTIRNKNLVIAKLTINVGSIVDIDIQDARGNRDTLIIEGQPVKSFDKYIPAWLKNENEPIDDMFRASQIASCAEGKGLLEATQRLFRVGETYFPAILLGESILHDQAKQLTCHLKEI